MNKVSENPLKNRFDKSDSYTIIAVFFTVCYIVSNIMAVKVVGIFGLFYFDAGDVVRHRLVTKIVAAYENSIKKDVK